VRSVCDDISYGAPSLLSLLLETPGEEFSTELTHQRSLEDFALISLKNVNMEARYDVGSQFSSI